MANSTGGARALERSLRRAGGFTPRAYTCEGALPPGLCAGLTASLPPLGASPGSTRAQAGQRGAARPRQASRHAERGNRHHLLFETRDNARKEQPRHKRGKRRGLFFTRKRQRRPSPHPATRHHRSGRGATRAGAPG